VRDAEAKAYGAADAFAAEGAAVAAGGKPKPKASPTFASAFGGAERHPPLPTAPDAALGVVMGAAVARTSPESALLHVAVTRWTQRTL
jgi:hypothetical protein